MKKTFLFIILYFFIFSSTLYSFQLKNDISEQKIFKDNFLSEINNYRYKQILNEYGALDNNALYELGKNTDWNINYQNKISILFIKGIIDSDSEMIDKGFQAIEYGLKFQLKDGSFINTTYYDVEQFVFSSVYSLSLLKQSRFNDQYFNKIDALIVRLRSTILFLKLNFNVNFYENFSSCKLASTAVCFYLSGKLINDLGLQLQSEEIVEMVLKKQREDGVMPESNEYDSYYQSVSLYNLMLYFIYSDNKILNEKIYSALEKGWNWQITRIKNDGSVIVLGNVGTKINYSDISFAIVYWTYLKKSIEYFPLARKVFSYGVSIKY